MKRHKPTTEHNWVRVLSDALEGGTVTPAGMYCVDIMHDDWCDLYLGRYCNCNVIIKTPVPTEECKHCGQYHGTGH